MTHQIITGSCLDGYDNSDAGRARRHAHEFHITPPWCVRDLLDYGPPELRIAVTGAKLEPCAGNGAIVKAVNTWLDRNNRFSGVWYLNELRAEEHAALLSCIGTNGGIVSTGDFLEYGHDISNVELCPMNTPFSLTIPFIERVWKLCPRAIVASLQRQSWRGSTARAHWLVKHQPRIYTFGEHRSRPSFRPDGKTDAAEYEWHVWLANERDCYEIPGGHVLQPPPGQEHQPCLF